MGTVYLGRQRGAAGFQRLVAIKRAHPHLLESPGASAAFATEARIAASIHHTNVVSVLDVEELDGELLLVMDYVEGVSLAQLLPWVEPSGAPMPSRVALRILVDACVGLGAVHGARDEKGRPLGVVHRDVSPQNVLVGVDGVAKITDFGVAKNASFGAVTEPGALKGKISYMAPEYVERGEASIASDVFAMGLVAWEALAQKRATELRGRAEEGRLTGELAALDPVIAKATERDAEARHESALSLARAL
jgi:serine/threonine-protein kinase